MPLESVYLNGGFIGITRSYREEVSVPSTPSFVVGTNYNLSDGTSFTYPSGIQEGDFIIIAQSNDSGDVSTPPSDSSSTSYTTLVQYTGSNPDYLITYKFADGTESGTGLTIQRSNSRGAAVIQVFRGVDSTTPFDVTYTTAASGGVNGDPDAPSITTVTDNSLVVAIGFLDDDSGVTVTVPSGYSNLNYGESSAGGGGDSVTMMASKLVATAGAEDPPVFNTTGNDAWQAVTVALRRGTTTSIEYQSGLFNLQAVLESSTAVYNYEAPYGTPDYTVTSFPSTDTGAANSNDVLLAIDATISSTDDGVLIDLGGNTGTGLAVGVSNGTLRARAFDSLDGTEILWNVGTATAYVEVDISAYTGSAATYYVTVDASTFTLSVYVQPGGKGSSNKKVFLGSDAADGTVTQVYGGAAKGYGQVGTGIADLEAAYEVNFTGTITEIRYWAETANIDISHFGFS